MGNILVVEPRKVLQHATAIALFPEHEARIAESIPKIESIDEFDAVIIDGAALREADRLTPEKLHEIETWKTPLVWLDIDPARPPERDHLVVVKRPISRAAIRAALAQCLDGAAPSKTEAATDLNAAALRNSKIIELVDVVEQESARYRQESEKRKKS